MFEVITFLAGAVVVVDLIVPTVLDITSGLF
jgi:hypothetical protein